MTVSLSPIGGAASQFFNSGGVPLYGGKIYTYEAGTTTPKATYTEANGLTAHSNPIILDSAGRVPGGEIWLTSAQAYLFILKTSSEELIGTYDNIYGYSAGAENAVTEVQIATAGQTSFTLTSMAYTPGVFTLGVYIDGVNQVVNNSYVETSATTVTFVSGLHVGAVVKFININSAATDSNVVNYLPAGAGVSTTTVQAKLRESVSVKDFGAVGDGVTDDTVAIQAAIDATYAVGGGTLYFPRGNYKIASSLNLKTGVSLKGAGGGITSNAASILTGGGGASPILQYVGSFGSESRLNIEISGLYFTGAQYGVYLKGAANVHIHHNTFGYIRGSESHSAILLENGILINIIENFFFYCACAVRGDAGINYHNVIARNDITIDDCAGLSAYKVFGILIRCNSTDVGFGPLNIRDNNFVKVSGGGSSSGMYGVYISGRGENLNITGNTFEAIGHNNICIVSIDPITGADHVGDATGMYVMCGEISGNFFIDGANATPSERFIQMNYGCSFEISSNYFMPQAPTTGRSMVFFGSGSYNNVFQANNKFNYRSGYTGVGVEDSSASYGKSIIWNSAFIDKATDGPNVLTLNGGSVFKLEPNSEYAPRLSQFDIADEGCTWYSSVSHRTMLVTQDGGAVVHARYSLETPPRYIANLGGTLTLTPADITIRVASNVANLANISTAYYDGQILHVFNIGATWTIAETGNIRVRGGTTLALAQYEGATFVWSANDALWIHI